jgi:hypothetical protein
VGGYGPIRRPSATRACAPFVRRVGRLRRKGAPPLYPPDQPSRCGANGRQGPWRSAHVTASHPADLADKHVPPDPIGPHRIKCPRCAQPRGRRRRAGPSSLSASRATHLRSSSLSRIVRRSRRPRCWRSAPSPSVTRIARVVRRAPWCGGSVGWPPQWDRYGIDKDQFGAALVSRRDLGLTSLRRASVIAPPLAWQSLHLCDHGHSLRKPP